MKFIDKVSAIKERPYFDFRLYHFFQFWSYAPVYLAGSQSICVPWTHFSILYCHPQSKRKLYIAL